MNNLNCVMDISTKAILTFTKSYSSAVAVSQGLINTEPLIIPTSISAVYQTAKQFNLVEDHLCSVPGAWLKSLPKALITQDYLDKKKIANLRATYIFTLEQHFGSMNSRGNVGFDDTAMAVLMREYDKCDPTTGYYTFGVVEYANINDITPEVAYQEIGIMIETGTLIKIRTFAWMQICIDRLNAESRPAELNKVWLDCWEQVKRAAFT